MPKIPGRADTKPTLKIKQAEVASFIMQHEEWYWRRPCNIEGCDHRMGPDASQPGWVEWKSCDEKQIPAIVVRRGETTDEYLNQPQRFACPCCVAKILA